MAASIPGMSLLRERPWLVALVAGVFGIVLRMAPWPLNWIGGGILTALFVWACWALWAHRGAISRRVMSTYRAIRRRIIGANVDDIQIETRSAVRVAADDSVEADMVTAATRAAWVSRIEYLTGLLDSPAHALRKDQRLDAERQLRQLRRSVRDLDTAEGRPVSLQTHGARPLAAFGPVAAVTGGWQLWAAGGLLAATAAGWGMAYVNDLRADRNEARVEEEQARAANLARALDDARDLNMELAAQARAADDLTRQTAATIERERAAANQARRREREYRNELQSRLRDVGDPPAWSLRDGGNGDGSAAPGSDSGAADDS